LLIVLGGPIGAYEEEKYPFLVDEIALIEDRLSANLPTLGICLGAQLMARALGARVYPGPAKEIGFASITLTEAGRQSCLAPFADHSVLHWHGDTFDIPEGAVRLASTDICPNQAFAVGRHALGVQFHPEAGGPGFERWLIGHTLELAMAGIDVAALRAEYDRLVPSLAPQAQACTSAWLAGLEG
jgi:GMP synthase (glutamine-hydrolysing)